MLCKNCGATLHEGETFCRTCAAPVNVDPQTGLVNISNPATNSFMQPSNSGQQQVEPVYQNHNFETVSAPVPSPTDEDTNKNLIKDDGNDRTGATIKNLLGLAILVIIIIVIAILLYNNVFKDLF